jgi:pyridoxamine 5'-phosphate oxidase family protein
MFAEKELAYIKSLRLARIATVSSDGQPDVAVARFEFDGEFFYVGGRTAEKTLKYKNVLAGNTRVALVIDDLAPGDPPTARGIKIHGTAVALSSEERRAYLKITPVTHWSWGIVSSTYDVRKFSH